MYLWSWGAWDISDIYDWWFSRLGKHWISFRQFYTVPLVYPHCVIFTDNRLQTGQVCWFRQSILCSSTRAHWSQKRIPFRLRDQTFSAQMYPNGNPIHALTWSQLFSVDWSSLICTDLYWGGVSCCAFVMQANLDTRSLVRTQMFDPALLWSWTFTASCVQMVPTGQVQGFLRDFLHEFKQGKRVRLSQWRQEGSAPLSRRKAANRPSQQTGSVKTLARA